MNNQQYTHLVVIEEDFHIYELLSYSEIEKIKHKLLCIATSEKLRNILIKNNFNCQSTIEYFKDEDHFWGLEKNQIILDKIQKALDNLSDLEYKKNLTGNIIFKLQFFTTSLLYNYKLLRNVLNKNPSIKSIFVFNSSSFDSHNTLLDTNENTFNYIVNSLKTKLDLAIITLGEIKHKKNKLDFKILNQIVSLLFNYKLKNSLKSPKIIFTTSNSKNLLLHHDIKDKTHIHYLCISNLNDTSVDKIKKLLILFIPDSLRRYIYNKKFNYPFQYVWFLDLNFEGKDFENFTRKILDIFNNIPEDCFQLEDILFQEAVLQKCLHSIIPWSVKSLLHFKNFEQKINTEKKHTFFSIENTGISLTMGEYCRKTNAQGYLISHGAHSVPTSLKLENEIIRHGRGLIISDYPYTIAQSKLSYDFILKYVPSTTVLKTGPIIWGITKQASINLRTKYRIPQTSKIIMHASTPKVRSSQRFLLYETLDEYCENIKDLIKVCNKLKDIHLIIKIRENKYFNSNDFNNLIYNTPNVSIDNSSSFPEVLSQIDLLISYSSTTLEEALINNIPAFQYHKNNRFQLLPSNLVPISTLSTIENDILSLFNKNKISTSYHDKNFFSDRLIIT